MLHPTSLLASTRSHQDTHSERRIGWGWWPDVNPNMEERALAEFFQLVDCLHDVQLMEDTEDANMWSWEGDGNFLLGGPTEHSLAVEPTTLEWLKFGDYVPQYHAISSSGW